MFAPTVILDACVLYPAPLRDLLMHLAAHDLIHAKWSEKIHEEWITAILRVRPDLSRAQLERTRTLMDKHAGDCLVEDYEKHIEALILPDANDRHVLAAAIECSADAIVTWNLSDFPPTILLEHGIAVWTPDELVMQLLKKDEDAVTELMSEHRASLKHPPKSVIEYLDTLEQQRLNQTVAALKTKLADL